MERRDAHHSDLRCFAAGVVFLCTVLLLGQSLSARSTAGSKDRLLFTSNRDGNYEIFVMNSDGSGLTQLTRSSGAWNGEPSWSPDGKKIAFVSNRDGNVKANLALEFEIYVMNADGSGLTRLTKNRTWDGVPKWSPDGKRIAFETKRGITGKEMSIDQNTDIFVINSDGSGETRLTKNSGNNRDAQWSPDGKSIVFVSNRDGNEEIYTMNADGTRQRRLTKNKAWDGELRWSPDGKKIAFVSTRDGNDEVYVMNPDGSGQTNLTSHSGPDGSPSWSPDSKRVVFHSKLDGNMDIYVMNADGTQKTRLTRNTAWDARPAWSPDGAKIAFISKRDENEEIYVMSTDGSGESNLTKNSASETEPSWLPKR